MFSIWDEVPPRGSDQLGTCEGPREGAGEGTDQREPLDTAPSFPIIFVKKREVYRVLTKPGTTSFNEILDQPAAWSQMLAHLEAQRAEITTWLKTENFGQVLFVGCGASYHAGLCGARTFHGATALNAQALPASEVLYAPRPPYDVRIKTLLIAASRCGSTSETLWAVEKLKTLDTRLKVLTLSCTPNAALHSLGHLAITLPGLSEEGATTTRSFSGTLLAFQVLASWLAPQETFYSELRRLPELVDVKKHQSEIQKAVALKPAQVTVLGSGANYGLACATALLLRTMAAQPADAMSLLEFRHGAHNAVLPNTLIVAYLSDRLRKAEEDMLREIAVMRGPRLIIAGEADHKTKMGSEFVFELGTELSELSRMLLTTPIVQLLAFYLAIAKGHNPDRPKHFQRDVHLKERVG
jgi:glutamine---fructose-6-phosphate transaminase (isomerizing)